MEKEKLVDEITAIAYAQGFIEAKANREDISDELQGCIYRLTDMLKSESTENTDNNGCEGCIHRGESYPCDFCMRICDDCWESE